MTRAAFAHAGSTIPVRPAPAGATRHPAPPDAGPKRPGRAAARRPVPPAARSAR